MKNDIVLDKMLELGVAITQRNYLEFAYFGDKHSVADLEGEEFAMLPDGFEDWPAEDLGGIN
jgi:hypothetical protein